MGQESFGCVLGLALVVARAGSTSAQPAPATALVGVTVIDGRGGPALPDMTLVLRGGRIEARFHRGEQPLPSGARVINLAGRYVIPGLIDSHVHLPPERARLDSVLGFMLRGGITTVRDMAGDAVALAAARERQRAGQPMPAIHNSAFFAGPTFFAADPRIPGSTQGKPPGSVPWFRAITPETDLVIAVREAKALGVDAIKIYSDLSADLIAGITREAHRQGLKVWAHPAVFPTRPSQVVAAGVDGISHSALLVWEASATIPPRFHVGPFNPFGPAGDFEHVAVDAPAILALLDLMKARGVILDPNVATIAIAISRPAADWTARMTRVAHERGVELAAGTDMGESVSRDSLPSLHRELEALVRDAGLTPLEAIRAATLAGARLLGLEAELGTVEAGKRADLVVLDADPAADIRNTRRIAMVFQGGLPVAR